MVVIVNIDSNTFALILTHFFTLLIGLILNYTLIRRTRLISYLSHVSVFSIRREDGNNIPVFTHQLVVRNVGSKPAKNVRIGHRLLPPNFNIYPKIQYEVVELPDGGKEIIIPNMVKGEEISISYLYYPPITWDKINTQIKSDEGFAKRVNVLLTRHNLNSIENFIHDCIISDIHNVLVITFVPSTHFQSERFRHFSFSA